MHQTQMQAAVFNAEEKIAALREAVRELREALGRIADIRATGPYPSPHEGMASALAALEHARDIARAALSIKVD